MKVVITGATGNLGTSVLSALVEDSRVREIVGLARRLPDAVFAKTRFLSADVATAELEPYFRGADAVIHLAWRIQSAHSAEELERANVVGSWRVFRAAAAAGVRILLHASSVGAYSRSQKLRLRDETWPADGIATSQYSQQKARVERLLDEFEASHRGVRAVRFRPALIFKRDAATHVRQLFLGPIVPRFVFSPRVLRWVADHPDFRFQAVHADDVAQAFRLALFSDARGAFNLAAEPVLDSETLAKALGARKVGVRPGLLRAVVAAGFHLRLQPADPGWVDLCFQSPLLDTSRARSYLGWQPRVGAIPALFELLDGLRTGASFDTPPLRSALEPAPGQNVEERAPRSRSALSSAR